jgi:hypothetical protein
VKDKEKVLGRGTNRRSFDCASCDETARGSAQDDTSYSKQSLTLRMTVSISINHLRLRYFYINQSNHLRLGYFYIKQSLTLGVLGKRGAERGVLMVRLWCYVWWRWSFGATFLTLEQGDRVLRNFW